MAPHHDHPEMDEKTGQPKSRASRQLMEKAHGRYSASDAKEGPNERVHSRHPSSEQPKAPHGTNGQLRGRGGR